MRSKVSAVLVIALGLLAAGSGIVAAAGDAGAATDQISIVSAGSPTSSVGDLTVVADSAVTITAMTASLVPFNTADAAVLSPVLTETGTTSTRTSQTQSTWSVATPIAQSQLPFGDYAIGVNVTFSDSTTASLPDVGVLAYGDQLTFSATSSTTVVSYDKQVVTVTGSVTALAPDGTSGPFANQSITMASSIESDTTVPTDADGDFSVKLSPHGAGWLEFEADVNSGSEGMSNPVDFTAQLDPVKMSVSLSAGTITYGSKVTATGTVTYQPTPGGGYAPLPGNTVKIYKTQNPYTPAVSVTTNASGHFSLALPAVAGDTTWTFDGGGVAGDPYLSQASVKAAMKVNLPTAITGFHASLNRDWQLSYSGCVELARSMPGSYLKPSLVIQYAASPKGPWRTLSVGAKLGGACGNQGKRFTGSATTPASYAYYRAYDRAVPSVGGVEPGWTAASSPTVLAWKYADRISGLSVSPRSLSAGHNLTVKGQLQYYRSGWHDYGSQLVYIVYRPAGKSTWYWNVTAKTSSAGKFSATFKDQGSATWSALYEGSPTHLEAGGPGYYVTVKG